MTDITNVFKATIKALKSRHKAEGLTHNNNVDNGKHPLLAPRKEKSDFANRCQTVCTNITKLRGFLLQHRKNYINAGGYLMSGAQMEDTERNQIDQDCEKVIKTCQDTIKHFKQEASAQKVSPQVRQHWDGVISLLEAYLKSVCKMYSEQRAVRVKRVVDKKRISRLEPEQRLRDSFKKLSSSDKPVASEEKAENETGKIPAKDQTNIKTSWQPSDEEVDEEDVISPEEAEKFEEENQALMDEMHSLMSEVKQIEGKVLEVSQLQEIFAENVWDQEKKIDQIYNTVSGTSENVTSGNEQIREAMKNNAGFRVWILFFLVVCTFALLFLDWYND
ncbi:syntaxin-18 [Octopus sinensis]|uniref:Syntaxin-18 n=1 Tax=Octopus sinensis TaxID=2607531 RepID=A0A6P7T371_9MOLL|nr:syntaxin-18 [Octopus sinensis]